MNAFLFLKSSNTDHMDEKVEVLFHTTPGLSFFTLLGLWFVYIVLELELRYKYILII